MFLIIHNIIIISISKYTYVNIRHDTVYTKYVNIVYLKMNYNNVCICIEIEYKIIQLL